MSVFFLLLRARNSNLPGSTRDKTFDSWKFKSTSRLPDVQPGFIKDDEWELLLGLCSAIYKERIDMLDAASDMMVLSRKGSDSEFKVPNDQALSLVSDVVIYSVPLICKTLFGGASSRYQEHMRRS
ncbi:unnamed protein product [Phytophthora lilii]|uniref:Unnamed protein product n=1 Tax=Phytophthora lilii TaxID=2077276 RepID=A0A9W6U6S6_9STRA|nr:unnamed protein product [Phytophthora lilii]